MGEKPRYDRVPVDMADDVTMEEGEGEGDGVQ